MNRMASIAAFSLCAAIVSTAFAQTPVPTSGPAEGGSPAWTLKGSFPDPGGRTSVDANGVVTVLQRPEGAAPAPVTISLARGCRGTLVCQNRNGPARGQMQRVLWEENLGYNYTYPIHLPAGTGGVPAVALDSKNNLWVYQRKPEGLPQLYTDREKLLTILRNLVENGVKYGAGRPVTIEVAGERGTDAVVLRVRDQGIGIAAEEVPHVFDPFRRTAGAVATHAQGVGLGLYIVRQFVELLHGTIQVESALGGGTTFTVRLPRQLRRPPDAGSHA